MKIQIKTGILAILVILIIVSYSYLPSRGPTLQIKPQPAAGPEATAVMSQGTAPLSSNLEQTPIATIPITIQPRDYSQLGLTEEQTENLESAELAITLVSYIG